MGSENADSSRAGVDPDESHVQFEWEGTTQPSTAIVEAVAAATDRSPTELEPIHDSIDTDSLDRLFDSENVNTEKNITVAFRYEGVGVVVDSQRGIEVRTGPEDGTVSEEPDSV